MSKITENKSTVPTGIILGTVLFIMICFVGIIHYHKNYKERYKAHDIGWSLVLYSDQEAWMINGIKYDLFYVQLPENMDDTEENSQIEAFIESDIPESDLMTKLTFPHSLSAREEVFIVKQYHRNIPGQDSLPIYSIKRRLE